MVSDWVSEPIWNDSCRVGAKRKTIAALTVVPVTVVYLCAFGLGNDIREFACGTLRSLLYTRHVVDPNDKTACRVAMIADMRGGVLAPGKHGLCWEELEHVPVLNLVPGRRV